MDNVKSSSGPVRRWRFPESKIQPLFCQVQSTCGEDQLKQVTIQEESSALTCNLPDGEGLNGIVVSATFYFESKNNEDATAHVALAITNTDSHSHKMKVRTRSGEWEDVPSENIQEEEGVSFLQTTVSGSSYKKLVMAVVSTPNDPEESTGIFMFERTISHKPIALGHGDRLRLVMVPPTDGILKKNDIVLKCTHAYAVDQSKISNPILSHSVMLSIPRGSHPSFEKLVIGLSHFEAEIRSGLGIVMMGKYHGSEKWVELEQCKNSMQPDVKKIAGFDRSLQYCWSVADLSKISEVTLVVTVREKIDIMTCGPLGGLLQSTVDNTVSIKVPPSALPEGSNVSLKVLNLNEQVLEYMKTKPEEKALLQSLQEVTPVYSSSFSSKPTKPVRFTSRVPRKRSTNKIKRQLSANDLLHLLLRSASGTWESVEDSTLNVKDDVAHFELDDPHKYSGYRLMKTDKTVKKENLPKIAAHIDSATDHSIVNFLFMQKADDEYDAYVDCVDKEMVDNVVNKCDDYGYKKRMPGKDMIIKDGQKVAITFGGNICPAHASEDFEHFVFNSLINRARREMRLIWVDENRQKTFPKFTGFIEFSVDRDSQETPCRFEIQIPKPPERPTVSSKREPELDYQPPFSDTFFTHLTDKLSGSDMDRLKQHTTFQRLHCGRDTLRMFRSWYRLQPKNQDKLIILRGILIDIGCDDVANGLSNGEVQDQPRPPRTSNIEVAFKEVIANERPLQHWKKIGRELDVPEADLTDIENRNRDNLSECCIKMLKNWHDREGSAATPSKLVATLRRPILSMVLVAENIERVCNLN